jgi:hypothetical protein
VKTAPKLANGPELKEKGAVMVAAVLFMVSGLFLSHSVLVVLGILKGPVLHTFEKYGDEEHFYDSLTRLALGLGVFSLASGLGLGRSFPRAFFPLETMGITFLVATVICYRASPTTRKYFRYPIWYFELLERTSRSERRRIAFMWLNLSRKGKLILNSSDHAFNQWADLIIVSTVYIDT